MDFKALENSLDRQLLSPVYLFHGDETYLRDGFVDKFINLIPEGSRDFNIDLLDGSDVGLEAIIGAALSLPFLSERRMVIVKNAGFFKAKRKGKGSEEEGDDRGGDADKALLAYLENPAPTTCLIFCADGIDKKKKVYKAVEKNGQVVEFAPLKGKDLNNWMDRRARTLGKVLEPQAAARLVTSIGSDLRQLNVELEKLSCYSETSKITAEDVAVMVSKTVESSIFDLVDAVAEKNYQKAVKMAREMVFLGEPVIKIIFMIARQFRLLLMTKDLIEQGYSEKTIASQLQVHPFVAQKCVKQGRSLSTGDLKKALEIILTCDADIKRGRQDAMLALELLIVRLCGKGH